MADFRSCIDDALTTGEIGPEAAELAREAYDDAFATASEAFGPVDADRAAADAVMAKLEAARVEARRHRQMMIRSRRALLEGVAGLKTRRGYTGVQALGGGAGGRPPKGGWVQGGAPPAAGQPYSGGALAAVALKRLVENRPGLSGAPAPSIVGRYRAVRGDFDAMMADVIERFETRTGFDQPGRADMANVGREGFGQATGDKAAAGLAQAWAETAEWARLQFNAAGGDIGKMEGWGFPTRWNSARVREVGRDAWVQAAMPRLNRAKMVDRMTGQPFTDKRLEAVLGDVWQNIAEGGASKRRPGEGLGQGALAKQRRDERFLIWTGHDAWAEMQDAFGEGDLYQAMMGHLDDMALDIAQLQILGPNPRHQFDWLANFARREAAIEEAAGVKGARDRAEGMVIEAERMLAHFTGDLNVPVNTGLASAGGTVRGLLTGAMLGSAVLGEVGSGAGLGRMARGFVGLDRNGDMGELVRLIADPAERAIARRTGFIIETAMDGFVQGSHDNLRLMSVGAKAEDGMNALARRLPSAAIRMQGLSGLVAARKRAFRFELMGTLHDIRGKSLADLAKGDVREQALGRWLDARGFDEDQWGIIRATPAQTPRPGADFLVPRDVADRELGLRLSEAIDMETRLVSPETTMETRAWWTHERPGTIMGEVQRSTGMFKGFTATLTTLYAEEIALQAAARATTQGGRLAMMAGMAAQGVLFLTIGGALSVQLRETAKGNDPLAMDDPKFWGKALSQGGGAGIFGDFLYAAEARNGKTAPITALGPVGQLGSDSWGLTAGNVGEIGGALMEGDSLGDALGEAKPGREAAAFLTRYNPLASQWWSRAAYTRLVGDNVQRALDPEAEEAFARRAKRMQRETGQGQWWPQGSTAPERAPDLAASLGQFAPE